MAVIVLSSASSELKFVEATTILSPTLHPVISYTSIVVSPTEIEIESNVHVL